MAARPDFMTRFGVQLGAFLHDRRGATAIEYAMIAALVSIAIIASVNAIGTTLKNAYYGVTANTIK